MATPRQQFRCRLGDIYFLVSVEAVGKIDDAPMEMAKKPATMVSGSFQLALEPRSPSGWLEVAVR